MDIAVPFFFVFLGFFFNTFVGRRDLRGNFRGFK